MKVSLICALTSSCLLLTLNQGSLGQSKATRASVAAESSDREQDGLNGPVRRVRVETAKVTVKDGQLVEGPRVLSEIATYDPRGQKIDSVAYPVEASTLPGKQEYRYDDHGNIVEMTLRGGDGSTLSKESYKYELDELGNWNKMTSSVAIFENGKISYEPIEVTYRTIAYYYGQAVDKLGAAAKREARSQIKPPATPASITPKTSAKETAEASRVSTTGASVADSNEAVIEPRINDQANNEAKEEVSPAPQTEEPSKPLAQVSSAASNTGGLTIREKSPSAPLKSVSVKRITETELRNAAVHLPEPEHSGNASVPNGKVEVQVVIGESGEVLNARAMSGHPLLIDSAEAAARKASFSRTKLTSDSGQLFGIITYDFKAPEPKVTLLSSSVAAPTENSKRADPPANSVPTKPIPAASTSTSNTAPPAEGNRENSAGSHYDKGLAFLSTGKYPEAVEALKQSVRINPNDAKSYLKLGLAYSVQGQNKETVAALKMAIQIRPEAVDAQGYYHLGHAYAGLGKHKDALQAFKQALYTRRAEAVDGSKPENAPPIDQLHLGIGTMHYNLRRHYEAIEELRKAIELNPKLGEAYYVVSLAYLAVGNRTAAENLHKTLQSLDAKLAKQIAAALENRDLVLPCRNIFGLCR